LKVIQLLPELNEGGIERGVVELNREFVKRGATSIVISLGGKLVDQIESDGGKHIRFDVCTKNPFNLPFRIIRLKRLLCHLNPDIVHARSRLPAWMAYYASKSLECSFITTVHGLNSVNRYSEIMTKGARVIAVSEVVRDYIVKNYSIDATKVRVIQRGVDTDLFDPEKVDCALISRFREQYGLHDKYIVSSIGRITWLKDFETFIRSIAILKEKIPNIVGLIVGGARADKTEYLESLKLLAAKEGVADKIIFTGSQSEIVEIYAMSNLTVNASLKMGNIGRTVIESLAMNTPVISTTYEGLVDLVKDGVNGYLIRTENPQGLAEKILAAYRVGFGDVRATLNPEYTLTTMVQRTLDVYAEVQQSTNS
jgi:glycosyltransferase involved in cell wall biosynthesis